MSPEEVLLLVMHLIRKGGEPGDQTIFAVKVVSGRRRHMQAEGDAHGPVQAESEVAWILDVPEQSVDEDFHSEFFERDPMDGIRQRFAKAHRSTRYVPGTGTRAHQATSEEDPVRRDDDELDGEPRHPGVDGVVLALRESGSPY